MTIRKTLAFVALVAVASPVPAVAWGTRGHAMINRAAAEALPASLPSFLRSPHAAFEIASLGPEPDNLKGSGSAWDAQFDPGHYIDMLDDGTVGSGLALSALPATREAYDTALRRTGSNQYKNGYLPYSLLEGWEQLRTDFALWRVADYRAAHAATIAAGEFAGLDRDLRAELAIHDLGVWGHFVGDASQPLHVTVHFNGWGNYPNPENFSNARTTHSYFESTFVDRYAKQGAVAAAMPSANVPSVSTAPATQEMVLAEIERYLAASRSQVVPLYRIEKSGGFANGSPEAVRFADARLGAAAAELRDLVTWAYEDSLNEKVGYPAQAVRDILNGAPPPAGD